MAVNSDQQPVLPRGSNVNALRTGVAEGYGFPVFTTYSGRYEVVDAGADAVLRSF